MLKTKPVKQRIFEIIQIGSREDISSRIGDLVIVVSIILNIAVLFLGTFEELSRYFGIFKIIETITIFMFCIEYLLRIWTAEYIYMNTGKWKAKLKFMISAEGIIDLFTILPFFFLYGFAAFRMLRVVRIFHLFRLNTNYDSFNVITSVLLEKKNQIVSSIFIIVVLMLASSLCIYGAEHDAQPNAFKNAFSGIWWSMSTIFTVGYGDIYPITVVGKIMGVVITFLGVGSVAIPTGIISAGFVENYTEMQRNRLNEVKNKTTSSITIEKKSDDVGKLINELEKKYGVDIVVILRDGVMIMAEDKIRVKAGDILIYRDVV
nr:ion transporter [uncultured Catonella sp.]